MNEDEFMKRILYVTFMCSILINSSAALSEPDNLRRVAEYHISATDLVTFSRSGATLRICSECEPKFFTFASDFQMFEMEETIDVKRATELFVRKTYEQIYVAIDRKNDTARYFRFGGHSDDR